jgi:hypothetical protein
MRPPLRADELAETLSFEVELVNPWPTTFEPPE